MPERLDVLKTYKLCIDGAFPRSESGRSTPVLAHDARVLAHVAKASRKDLRDAIEAARRAQPKWSDATAYLRGQILYRMAEMMEGKRAEFAQAIDALAPRPKSKGKGSGARFGRLTGAEEVSLAVDRLVAFAGWADKFAQVVGCQNPVAGAFYNFTIPEATGVVVAIAPDECPLLALVSLLAPPLCAGNAVVALAGQANPLPGAILGEVIATSDVPAGVLNILTGDRSELLPHVAGHRDVDAVHAGALGPGEQRMLREGIAENLKRVHVRDGVDWRDGAACQSPWWIEGFVEFKTIWHPSAV